MAVDKKISQLASGAPAQAGDEYVVARSGANFKLTLTNIAASMPPIGATTPNTGSFTSLTNSGNLTFSSTAQRITGDFSNATLANRLAFQTSTTNGNTIVGALPNGTGTNTRLQLFSASDPANASTASMEANATSSLVIINADKTGTGTYLPMTFYTGGSERMRITSGGELLIGTTARINATASPLQAYATTGSGIVVQMTQSGSDTISVWNSATTGDNDFIDFYTEGTATLRGNITYNRGAGQVAYNITSDVRLKENIADAVDAGDKIDAMQVRQFDWKETGNHLDYGFVAQELHNVAPHAVSKPTNDDEMWSVDYSKLVPILVKELQAVRARLAALEAK